MSCKGQDIFESHEGQCPKERQHKEEENQKNSEERKWSVYFL